jgi:hypothetical protein
MEQEKIGDPVKHAPGFPVSYAKGGPWRVAGCHDKAVRGISCIPAAEFRMEKQMMQGGRRQHEAYVSRIRRQ